MSAETENLNSISNYIMPKLEEAMSWLRTTKTVKVYDYDEELVPSIKCAMKWHTKEVVGKRALGPNVMGMDFRIEIICPWDWAQWHMDHVAALWDPWSITGRLIQIPSWKWSSFKTNQVLSINDTIWRAAYVDVTVDSISEDFEEPPRS